MTTQRYPLRKTSIPAVSPDTLQPGAESHRFLEAVKQNLDVITGRAKGGAEIPALPATASLANVITTINQIIAQINASGV